MRKSYILALMIVLLMMNGCGDKNYESRWTDIPVSVDGDNSDWSESSLTYFDKMQLVMGISNDEENLYVIYKFNDIALARRIQMRGVTLWFNADGKKNKNFGIQYYGDPSVNLMNPEQAGFSNLSDEQRAEFKTMPTDLLGMVIVNDNSENIPLPTSNMNGISAMVRQTDGIFTYEFKVPLTTSEGRPYAINAKPGQKISFGLELGQPDMKEMQRMRSQMGGMDPGNGGMQGRGRAGGGMMPGMMNIQKKELWLSLNLALNTEK